MLRGFGVQGQSVTAARGWMVAAWAGAALAFLSKGLIGIVPPGAIFVHLPADDLAMAFADATGMAVGTAGIPADRAAVAAAGAVTQSGMGQFLLHLRAFRPFANEGARPYRFAVLLRAAGDRRPDAVDASLLKLLHRSGGWQTLRETYAGDA